jgi:hypothetical protein
MHNQQTSQYTGLPTGNLLSILVLLCYRKSLEMKRSYWILISSLVVWDLLFVMLAFGLYSLEHFSPGHYATNIFPYVVPVLYPLTQVFRYSVRTDIWSTLLFR